MRQLRKSYDETFARHVGEATAERLAPFLERLTATEQWTRHHDARHDRLEQLVLEQTAKTEVLHQDLRQHMANEEALRTKESE